MPGSPLHCLSHPHPLKVSSAPILCAVLPLYFGCNWSMPTLNVCSSLPDATQLPPLSYTILPHSDCSISACLAFSPGDPEPHVSKTRPCTLLLLSYGSCEPPESHWRALMPQLLGVDTSQCSHCLIFPFPNLPKLLEVEFFLCNFCLIKCFKHLLLSVGKLTIFFTRNFIIFGNLF